MTVNEIIEQYLKASNFDGLFNEDTDCACLVVDGLAPCGEVSRECKAGMRVACPTECGEHEWHVVEKEQ